jgi:hypothetical protein
MIESEVYNSGKTSAKVVETKKIVSLEFDPNKFIQKKADDCSNMPYLVILCLNREKLK